MIELIKEVLFWISLCCGSISLICLMLCATWRCICLFMDHCKSANAWREIIKYYVEHHNNRTIIEEDIRK